MLRKLGQYSLQNDSSWPGCSHRGKDWEWIISLCSLPAIPNFRKAYHTFYHNSSWQMRAFIVLHTFWSLCPTFVAVIELSSLWGLIKAIVQQNSLTCAPPFQFSSANYWNGIPCLSANCWIWTWASLIDCPLDMPSLDCENRCFWWDFYAKGPWLPSAKSINLMKFNAHIVWIYHISCAVCIYLTIWHLLFKVGASRQSCGL